MEMFLKEYLGDAVYVEFDGYHIVLTTEDGVRTTNRICLNPYVLTAYTEWIGRLEERVRKLREINQ